jgi:hypothetical protein
MRTLIAAALLAAVQAGAQQASTAPVVTDPSAPGVIGVDDAELTGPARVDRDGRWVTMKDQRGRWTRIRVDAQQLDPARTHTGDKLRVRYVPAVVLAVAKAGIPLAGESDTIRVAPKSGGVVHSEARTEAGVVQDLDRNAREFALKTENGDVVPLKLAADVPGWEQLNDGDRVTVRHSEAAAIAVDNREPDYPNRPRP